MDYPGILPNWQEKGPGHWGYEWETDEDYLAELAEFSRHDPNQAAKKFVVGMKVTAEARVEGDSIALMLGLENQSHQDFKGLICDGGCFQAKSPAFADSDTEVARSFIMVKGAMVSMATLPRLVAERCTYQSDPIEYGNPLISEGLWFWGRCETPVDSPVIVGMKSTCGQMAVVIGYEGSDAGSANADCHHCLHSRPRFGDIGPGEARQRRGYILFVGDIHELGSRLHRLLGKATVKS